MASFWYRAINLNGQLSEGTAEAESEKALRLQLSGMGLEVINFKQAKVNPRLASSRLKLKHKELANLFFELGMQLRAGVSILDALRVQTSGRATAATQIKGRLAQLLESGSTVHQGLAEFPRAFPNYILNIIKTAEQSGSLAENMLSLRLYIEWLDQNWKTFKQAMIYPSTVIAAIIIFIFVALKFIFPSILGLLYELEVPLPLLTRMLIAASDFVVAYWLWILVFAGISPLFYATLMRVSQRAVFARDWMLIKIPYLGAVVQTLAISRFLRSLSMMQAAGILITDSLAMGRDVVGNKVIEQSIQQIEYAVANGNTITEAIKGDDNFPTLVKTMIRVGERSGALDESIDSVVAYYDDLVPRQIKAFFSVLEPTLIVLAIVAAGLIAGAIFLPLVQLLSPGAFL